MPATAGPMLRICAICHEHQCGKGNDCQICFHDDVILSSSPTGTSATATRRAATTRSACGGDTVSVSYSGMRCKNSTRCTPLSTDAEVHSSAARSDLYDSCAKY